MRQSLQFSAVLFGTSLEFSDQFIRILAYEFSEVHFAREVDMDALSEHSPPPRLVVIHGSLPDLDGVVGKVRTQLPGTMIAVACTDFAELRKSLGPETLRSVGVLPLNTSIDVMLSILRLLLCGHSYVPAEVFFDIPDETPRQCEKATKNLPRPKVSLTPREMEILPYIARGLQNKVIAGMLELSEHTVKLHTHNIFSKLGVTNRTAAAKWYLSEVAGERQWDEGNGY